MNRWCGSLAVALTGFDMPIRTLRVWPLRSRIAIKEALNF